MSDQVEIHKLNANLLHVRHTTHFACSMWWLIFVSLALISTRHRIWLSTTTRKSTSCDWFSVLTVVRRQFSLENKQMKFLFLFCHHNSRTYSQQKTTNRYYPKPTAYHRPSTCHKIRILWRYRMSLRFEAEILRNSKSDMHMPASTVDSLVFMLALLSSLLTRTKILFLPSGDISGILYTTLLSLNASFSARKIPNCFFPLIICLNNISNCLLLSALLKQNK